MSNLKLENLKSRLNSSNYKIDEPISKHTSLHIGGPADIFYQANSISDFVKTVRYAKEFGVPVTVLGGGTNILVSDFGIRGLVIKLQSENIEIKKSAKSSKIKSKPEIIHRWNADKKKGRFIGIDFSDLNYNEDNEPRITVKIESGAVLQKVIFNLIENGITGLQWFSGIPGTIGGAVFNNIHGGSRFLSEFIQSVKILDKDGHIKMLGIDDLKTDYDKSRFHNKNEQILETTFSLFLGDTKRATYTAKEWFKRKRIQPRNSPGCIFKNISNDQKQQLNLPTTATGYIIDKILNMRGYKIGGAAISDVHCNFIVNDKNASAEDFIHLVKEIQAKIVTKLGIKIEPEIIFLGFDKKVIKDLY